MLQEWQAYGPQASLDVPRLSYGEPGMCIVGTRLYVFGTAGINGGGLINRMLSIFDLTTEAWLTDITMPVTFQMHYGEGGHAWHQMPVLSDGRIYVPQRASGDTPYIFDPADSSFTVLATWDGYGGSGFPMYGGLPPLFTNLVECTPRYLNGGVYYIGVSLWGTSYGNNHIIRHDPINDTWHYVGGCETLVSSDVDWGRPCVKVLDDQHLYILASYSPPTVAYILDVTTGTFSRTTNNCNLNGNTSNHTNAIKMPDGRIFVCGSETGSNASILDPNTMTFGYMTSGPTVRDTPGVLLTWDGKVHIIGGVGTVYSSVIYDPASDSYTSDFSMLTTQQNTGPSFVNPVTGFATSVPIWNNGYLIMQHFYDDSYVQGQMFPFTRTTSTPRGVASPRGSKGQLWPRTR